MRAINLLVGGVYFVHSVYYLHFKRLVSVNKRFKQSDFVQTMLSYVWAIHRHTRTHELPFSFTLISPQAYAHKDPIHCKRNYVWKRQKIQNQQKKQQQQKNIKKQNERRTEAKEYRKAKQRMEPNSSLNTHIHINSIQLNAHPAKKNNIEIPNQAKPNRSRMATQNIT